MAALPAGRAAAVRRGDGRAAAGAGGPGGHRRDAPRATPGTRRAPRTPRRWRRSRPTGGTGRSTSRATRLVPDVMLGAVELLRLVTDPGDAVVINPPVYPPFAAFVDHADRRLVNAPLGPDGRLDLESLDRAFGKATATGPPRRVPALPPPQPHGHAAHGGRAAGGRRAGRPARRAGGRRRDPRPARARRPAAGSCPRRRRSPTRSPCTRRRRRSTWPACAPRSRCPDRRRWTTSPACPRSSPTASRTSVPSPSGPPTARAAPGWTRCSTGSGTTSALVADLLADAAADRRLVTAGGDVLRVDRPARARRRSAAGADPARLALHRGRLALNPGPTFGVEGTGFVRLNLAASTATLTDAVARLAHALEDVATDS